MRFAKIFLAVLLTVVAAAPSADARKMSQKKIDKTIEGFMEDNMTTGLSVVFFKGNEVIFQKAYGYRDAESKTPLCIDDKFRIASISKSFSGASIMQLVEAGKISLDDDIRDIMGMNIRNPRFPDDPITVGMLLSHTSSMIDGKGGAAKYRDLTYIDPSKQPESELLKRYNKYAPGKGYKYCNRALNMMGCVIERASGERFDNYILNHILRPMGFTEKEAGFNIDTLEKSDIATLYVYNKEYDNLTRSTKAYNRKEGGELAVEDGTYVIGSNGWGWSPTGGMKISAPNLAKWCMTLKNGGVAPNGVRIIPEEGCRKMLTPVTQAENENRLYGMTIRIIKNYINGKTLKGHTGSAQGLKSAMFFCPEEDWGFVVIASSTNGQTEDGLSKIYYQTANFLYEQLIAE